MVQANVDRDWEGRYRRGETPWDSGLPSRELQRVLEEGYVRPCRTIELGCGTGTNSLFLAQLGFEVTAVDCSPKALQVARQKAGNVAMRIEWVVADVQNFGSGLPPFDFVFDRGCYHCCRRVNLHGYLATLEAVTHSGSRYLSLSGNANEVTSPGPPTVTEDEVRVELGQLFEFEFIRPFRFQDPGGVDGPLGWSALMRRRN